MINLRIKTLRARCLILFFLVIICTGIGRLALFSQVPGMTPDGAFQKKCKLIFQNTSGCLIAVQPDTGKILAMVNPRCVFSESKPPGSLFKLVTAAAALSERLINKNHTESCKGNVKLHKKIYKCWLKRGHGRLSLKQALSQSCNIYFYRLGLKIPASVIKKYAVLFGLSKPTGAEFPDEDSGELPETFSRDEAVSFAAGEHPQLKVTPAQIAVFISAVANGGRIVKPSWSSAQGNLTPSKHPMTETLIFLKDAMRQSVHNGTCSELSLLKKDIAAKTGTARHPYGYKTHAWFAGFYPAEKPQLALVIFLQNGTGRHDAVPLARKIFKAYFTDSEDSR